MDTLIFVLFLYVLLTIPVFVLLMLFAVLTRSARLRRAAEVVSLSACAALLVLTFERAFEKPLLWIVVVLLVAVLAFGVSTIVKAARERP
ncbi:MULTISPECIES: hypothetical protein [Micromonospora]|uniref:Uncharacterized protein n=1 Tax=Micromonospora chalcea TaxID=1874 RepID=A0ABX9Y400_MICCH|nr:MULTISPECIES: hypothetical protein [Micromonospora]EWM66268.1 hypothetical protein MCBG_03401 [Micromonospora sp. M42]MBC8988636.1 hypothetical protein [Micromonospora chalcea]MBP1780563.1 membrane protein insertase Oxa1/YidC/SpoIIIJ [Micromonospora sp. HB375]MBQ1060816.1 hypothetical protein [Micromonospora sp. C41]MBQ1069581.1 hypothetical protein [Micromonospora sp. D75]